MAGWFCEYLEVGLALVSPACLSIRPGTGRNKGRGQVVACCCCWMRSVVAVSQVRTGLAGLTAWGETAYRRCQGLSPDLIIHFFLSRLPACLGLCLDPPRPSLLAKNESLTRTY